MEERIQGCVCVLRSSGDEYEGGKEERLASVERRGEERGRSGGWRGAGPEASGALLSDSGGWFLLLLRRRCCYRRCLRCLSLRRMCRDCRDSCHRLW